MNTHIIITKEQADQIKGRHGIYSAIEPVPTPDGMFIVPERCLEDPDLSSVKTDLEQIHEVSEVQEITDLPAVGEEVLKDRLYTYSEGEDLETGYSGLIKCMQTHNRTIYSPRETPALFSFFRQNADDLEWITNEYVYVGWKRVYEGTTYEVIQEHMTQDAWIPTLTLNVLWKLAQTDEIPDWVQPTGAHDAYALGAQVKHNNAVWESTVSANVWEPGVYGWNKLYDL